jgi:hypothetical protein
VIDETKKAPSRGLLFFLHPLPLSIKGALGSCLALVEVGEAPGLGLVAPVSLCCWPVFSSRNQARRPVKYRDILHPA